ncbi:NADP-dependent oxidoreductase [Sphingobium estronivorans]|uniref:NADP-dependent oxidoreductase n=1 Tax=Sphingobium estronivorans TaxID=1577690 RepID=UPI001239D5BA|nr:NADP-dependent oxidoreductase [Sphingobium estronivorans]
MKAVGLTDFGGPEALEILDLPDPVAGPGQVLIRIHAAAVNPTDALIRSGTHVKMFGRTAPPPYVPGMDAAGVLLAIGEGVETDLNVGDPVIAFIAPNGSYGAYSEMLAVPANSVVKAPRGMNHVEASTILMNAMTARLAIDLLGLKPGNTVLISGAAGTFGGYAVELAKEDGLVVIADASEADEGAVKGFGADVVLRRGDDLAGRVRERFPDGVDGAIDGALFNERLAPAVRDGGTVITLRMQTGEADRGVKLVPVRSKLHSEERNKLDGLRRLAEEGKLTIRVAGTYPKERAGEAHQRLEQGGLRGRLVLEF